MNRNEVHRTSSLKKSSALTLSRGLALYNPKPIKAKQFFPIKSLSLNLNDIQNNKSSSPSIQQDQSQAQTSGSQMPQLEQEQSNLSPTSQQNHSSQQFQTPEKTQRDKTTSSTVVFRLENEATTSPIGTQKKPQNYSVSPPPISSTARVLNNKDGRKLGPTNSLAARRKNAFSISGISAVQSLFSSSSSNSSRDQQNNNHNGNFSKIKNSLTNGNNLNLQKKKSLVDIIEDLASDGIANNNVNNDLKEYKIIIKILTNWGNPEQIQSSKIQLLDIYQSPLVLQQDNVTIFPKEFYNESIRCLTETVELEKTWKTKFVKGSPISIIYKFRSDKEIKYVRFFNTTAIDQSLDDSIKDVEIWMNNELCWEGEVGKDFGKIVEFEQFRYDIKKRCFEVLNNDFDLRMWASDRHGVIPQLGTKTVSFVFLSNYLSAQSFSYLSNSKTFSYFNLNQDANSSGDNGNNNNNNSNNNGNNSNISINNSTSYNGANESDNFFGLSKIEFYDANMEKIDVNDYVESIELFNCIAAEFVAGRGTAFPLKPDFLEYPFYVKRTSIKGLPQLLVSFKQKLPIVEIMITNFLVAEYPGEHGVCKIKISFDDGEFVHCCKLQHDIKKQNSRNAVTKIYMNDGHTYDFT